MAQNKFSMQVWAQGPMRRIFPIDPVPRGASREISISAARGEYECFQVGVHVNGPPINVLTAEAGDLKGTEGARIAAGNVSILYPETVPVKWATAEQEPGDAERSTPAFFPDPLLPEWHFKSVGGEASPTHSVWIRVRVPRDARPGMYRGHVSVTALRTNGKLREKEVVFARKTCRIGFRLRVWDFEIPRRPRLSMTNWFFPEIVAEWYGVEMWSSAFWKLIGMFAADMADHRQNMILTSYFSIVNNEPVSSPHMVIVRKNGRRFSFDFSRFDQWCRVFLRHGFEWIEGGHLPLGGIRVTLPNGKTKHLPFDNAKLDRTLDFVAQFIQALWAHLGKRGLRKRFVQHIFDEPSSAEQFERYRRLADTVRKAAPGIRLIDAMHPDLAALVECPVIGENGYDRVLESLGKPVGRVWTYYCCGPRGRWPNRFIDYLPIRVRIFTWLCFRKNIPGFLHWGYNYWSSSANQITHKQTINPWDDTTGNRWPAGDPCVVYPPRDAGMTRSCVIDSIRWELIREAMEDYEYLALTRELAEAGDMRARAILRTVAEDIVPDWETHTRDERRLAAVRERMGALLSSRGRSMKGPPN